MTSTRITLLLVSGALLGPASARQGARETAEDFQPAKLYANACLPCHLPPDPQLPTDAAWIRQLADTA